MRALRIYSLTHCPVYHTAVLAIVVRLYSTSLVLIYNWKFVPLTAFLQFPLPPSSCCSHFSMCGTWCVLLPWEGMSSDPVENTRFLESDEDLNFFLYVLAVCHWQITLPLTPFMDSLACKVGLIITATLGL